MARGMALTQCYRDATSAVLRSFRVTDGDFWFANESKPKLHDAAGEASCQNYKAKFDAEDEPIIAAQAAAEAQTAQAKRNAFCCVKKIQQLLNLKAGWYT